MMSMPEICYWCREQMNAGERHSHEGHYGHKECLPQGNEISDNITTDSAKFSVLDAVEVGALSVQDIIKQQFPNWEWSPNVKQLIVDEMMRSIYSFMPKSAEYETSSSYHYACGVFLDWHKRAEAPNA